MYIYIEKSLMTKMIVFSQPFPQLKSTTPRVLLPMYMLSFTHSQIYERRIIEELQCFQNVYLNRRIVCGKGSCNP